MNKKLLASCAAAWLLAGCGGPVEDTRPGQPVKQRQDAFKALLRAFEPMGQMLRGKTYDADRFATLAAGFAARHQAPWGHFGADTHYPPTRARAEVWSRPETFAQEVGAFREASAALIAAAERRNEAEVRQAYDRLHASCKSCHRQFKD